MTLRPRSHVELAQRAAEARLELADNDLDNEPGTQDDLAGPYCGCYTCVIREVLDAAWPHLAEAAVQEWLSLDGGELPSWQRPDG